jgi:hypothetical protein
MASDFTTRSTSAAANSSRSISWWTSSRRSPGSRSSGSYNLDAPKGVRGRNSDNALIRRVLGWEPSSPLRDGTGDHLSLDPRRTRGGKIGLHLHDGKGATRHDPDGVMQRVEARLMQNDGLPRHSCAEQRSRPLRDPVPTSRGSSDGHGSDRSNRALPHSNEASGLAVQADTAAYQSDPEKQPFAGQGCRSWSLRSSRPLPLFWYGFTQLAGAWTLPEFRLKAFVPVRQPGQCCCRPCARSHPRAPSRATGGQGSS